MAPLFFDRERAAEGIFVRDEELRFLALRRGLQALGKWAGDGMGLDTEEAAHYGEKLVDAFVSGSSEETVVETVQTDLERAGKPSLSIHVGTVLAQAVAEATHELRGRPGETDARPADVRGEWERHHTATGHRWGWSL